MPICRRRLSPAPFSTPMPRPPWQLWRRIEVVCGCQWEYGESTSLRGCAGRLPRAAQIVQVGPVEWILDIAHNEPAAAVLAVHVAERPRLQDRPSPWLGYWVTRMPVPSPGWSTRWWTIGYCAPWGDLAGLRPRSWPSAWSCPARSSPLRLQSSRAMRWRALPPSLAIVSWCSARFILSVRQCSGLGYNGRKQSHSA